MNYSDGISVLQEHLGNVPKPLFRGWSHAGGAALAVVGAIWLIIHARSLQEGTTLLVYGISMIVLLTVSALYHIGNWSPAVKQRFRSWDHANIYVFIAGTYTPIIGTLVTGWAKMIILALVWACAIVGVATSTKSAHAPRFVVIGLYICMGWVGMIVMPQMVHTTGWAMLLVVGGGLLYTLGAVVYATKWPNPWPKIFGFHEVFHIAVLGATLLFFLFVMYIVSPVHAS